MIKMNDLEQDAQKSLTSDDDDDVQTTNWLPQCTMHCTMHNAHIIIIQQKIREAKQKCTDSHIIFTIKKISLKQLGHVIFPIAGQSSCQKFLTKRQFAIGGESGGFKLPAVLLFWSQDAAAAPHLYCISSFVSILFSNSSCKMTRFCNP